MTATEVMRCLLDEPDDAAMLKLHDRMNVALLEFERALGIEKADGAIVVPFVFDMHSMLEEAATLGPKVTGNTSDGYHTFNDLYHHRAVLFSVIVRDHRELAWKSMRHHDGTMYDGMFIVGIETPEGQATYHYDIDPYWDMFNCKELDQAPEWDGHTPSEAIERIATLGSCNCSNNCTNGERTGTCRIEYHYGEWYCTSCGEMVGTCDPESELCVDGNYVRMWRFCPNCGRKREDVSE